ncbi:T9SS type A sorting domain-containing protein [Rubrivirga marina]|uniref:Secretion system C-terminal sorting domain-containing protein n=1 Tax=Rubrivirga marina TaxID=1196024 RepID=A0A271J206_9BACT|nr:T9SS type A sorting domain-containing protein [Rubrivirga marina]PAP77084.1 hypothetical protein BSZ37_11925 [Rubrivirga marina]
MTTRLDTLARTLGASTSRRDALRALGAFAATTALSFAGTGFASPRTADRAPVSVRTGGACVGSPVPGLPEFCSNSSNCLCMDTPEGAYACAELPFDVSFCEAPTCASSADCAGLGPAYFCGSPGDEFCDDGLARCVAPCGLLDWAGTWAGVSVLGGERLDVQFEIADVEDALTGRLAVADPVTGAWVDLGTLSGYHYSTWGSWTMATGLSVAGEFSNGAFAGTLAFPAVGSSAAFVANVTLEKVGGPVGDEPSPPGSRAVELGAPYPNPARNGAAVTVPLRVAEPGAVRVAVFDVVGREVAVLHDGPAAAGDLRLTVDTPLAAGVYVVRATTGAAAVTRTLTVVR